MKNRLWFTGPGGAKHPGPGDQEPADGESAPDETVS